MEKKKEITLKLDLNIEVSFEQIWDLLQQLSDEKQVEMLDQLQGRLEKDGIIAIRQDRKAQYEVGLTIEQMLNEPKEFINYFDVDKEASEEEPEISDEEFYESLKNI